jgi:hypothetical protein
MKAKYAEQLGLAMLRILAKHNNKTLNADRLNAIKGELMGELEEVVSDIEINLINDGAEQLAQVVERGERAQDLLRREIDHYKKQIVK